MTRSLCVLLFWAVLLTLLGLAVWPTGQTSSAEPAVAYDPLVTRPNEEGDAGELAYRRYCGGCHGEAGDGKGPAARLLYPPPRDFTKGVYKFTSTPAGSRPLDEDLVRTLRRGLKGTSMPSWRLLPESELRSLARYVLDFHEDWQYRPPEPAVAVYANPFDMLDADAIERAIAQGREVYHKDATCWSCHPGYMESAELENLLGRSARDDLAIAIPKPDLWGESIKPPDFRVDALKSVWDLTDLYRAITAGVGGTAMPTWGSTMTAEQLWAMTLYVDSLRPDSIVNRTIEQLKEEEGL